MKLLLTHRYFWPDTAPYALMLRTIGEGLAENGHDVHVFASRPSYRKGGETAAKKEELGQLKVRRCWIFQENRNNPIMRAMNVALYCIALFIEIIRLRPHVVTASTFPPVAAAWTASLAARFVGARFIYHIQDIHPEVSQYSGGRLGRGLPAKVLRWLDNQTLRRSKAIVTLSRDMENTLLERNLGPLPISIIDNLPLDSATEQGTPPVELQKSAGTQRVIFAGNLGRFQNLLLLAEGVAKLFPDNPKLELFFLGEGAALGDLKARWGNHPQVRFGPFLPFSQAKGLIEEADVGLVSLAPDIYRVAYPSKVMTYLDLGVRVLALIEPNSHFSQNLETTGQGTVPIEPTPEAIGQALERALKLPAIKRGQKLSPTVLQNAWNAIVENQKC